MRLFAGEINKLIRVSTAAPVSPATLLNATTKKPLFDKILIANRCVLSHFRFEDLRSSRWTFAEERLRVEL